GQVAMHGCGGLARNRLGEDLPAGAQEDVQPEAHLIASRAEARPLQDRLDFFENGRTGERVEAPPSQTHHVTSGAWPAQASQPGAHQCAGIENRDQAFRPPDARLGGLAHRGVALRRRSARTAAISAAISASVMSPNSAATSGVAW